MDIGNLGKVLVEQLVDARLVLPLTYLLFTDIEGTAAWIAWLKKVPITYSARSMQQTWTPSRKPTDGTGHSTRWLIGRKPYCDTLSSLQILLEAASNETLAEDLSAIHGIGPKIAQSVANYLRDPHHSNVMRKMIELALRRSNLSTQPPPDGPLSGSSFCVTGTVNLALDSPSHRGRRRPSPRA